MRPSFTLIEMLVSVFIIGLITLFMYSAIASSKKSSDSLRYHANIEHNRTTLYDLLYRDLIESVWIEQDRSTKEQYHIVSMQTKNTLYDIAYPYVTYFVNSKTLNLTRLESAREIVLPISYDDKPYIYANVLKSEVSDFNIYTKGTLGRDENSSNSNSTSDKISRFLLFLDAKNDTPILLELAI